MKYYSKPLTIYNINKLKESIKKEGIESVIKILFLKNNIKIDLKLNNNKNKYIFMLKKYSNEIDKNNYIQDLKYGLPDFNIFSSFDIINWIFNVKINEEKLLNKNSKYFFKNIYDIQKEESIEKINELIIIILDKLIKYIHYRK